MLFNSGAFPSALKSAKVVPVHEKDSKLDFSNNRPTSLLSNIDKILEKTLELLLVYKFNVCFIRLENLVYQNNPEYIQ